MAKTKKFRALVGLNYPDGAREVEKALAGETCRFKRVEAGEIVTDLPSVSLKWLLDDGLIEEVRDE